MNDSCVDFSELIQKRRSVRDYCDTPIERWKLEELIEAVRLSPSASNSQPWKLIIVDDPVIKDRMCDFIREKGERILNGKLSADVISFAEFIKINN